MGTPPAPTCVVTTVNDQSELIQYNTAQHNASTTTGLTGETRSEGVNGGPWNRSMGVPTPTRSFTDGRMRHHWRLCGVNDAIFAWLQTAVLLLCGRTTFSLNRTGPSGFLPRPCFSLEPRMAWSLEKRKCGMGKFALAYLRSAAGAHLGLLSCCFSLRVFLLSCASLTFAACPLTSCLANDGAAIHQLSGSRGLRRIQRESIGRIRSRY